MVEKLPYAPRGADTCVLACALFLLSTLAASCGGGGTSRQPPMGNECATLNEGDSCGDGDLCTVSDTCQGGQCVGTPVDCTGLDDACNAGVCNSESGMCESLPNEDGGSCDDGNPCTENDVCDAGRCTGGGEVDCSGLDDGCQVGTCDTASGGCVPVPAPDRTPCDDEDPCTTGDQCISGTCLGGVDVDCSELDDGCLVGACEPETGECQQVPVPEGGVCEDGDPCTTGEICTEGVCDGGAPVDCSALDSGCVTGVCDPGSGECLPVLLEDGEACDDGSPCTEGSVCNGGACGGGTLIDCNAAAGPCEVGSCDPASGECLFTAAEDGVDCESENPCLTGGSCAAGECVGGDPVDCSELDGGCQVGACDPVSGECLALPAPDGTACEGDDPCSVETTCTAGACGGGLPVDCSMLDDPDGCVVGACEPISGACVEEPAADGLPCDDGDACTSGESCSEGGCVPTGVRFCGTLDGACTVGTCNADTGECEALPRPDGTECAHADPCLEGGTCDAGICDGVSVRDCSELDGGCQVGRCSPTTGECVAEVAGDGEACEDGDPCTTDTTCTDGVCGGGTEPDCSDLDGNCVRGTCDPETSECIAVPTDDDAPCDDGDACTTGETCTGGACGGGTAPDCSAFDGECFVGVCDSDAGGCTVADRADGAACDDNDPCTTGTTCQAGQCGSGAPIDCSALDGPCAQGVCDANGTCVAQAISEGEACDDGDLCTTGETCTAGSCGSGAALDCSGLDGPCATGSCDPAQGCVLSARNDGAACDDSDPCTDGTTCTGGECVGGATQRDCSALDGPCTVGRCNAGGDCVAAPKPDGLACDDGNGCTIGESCQGGECGGGRSLDCTSLDGPCAEGVCDNGACLAQPRFEGQGCEDGDPCSTGETCVDGSCVGGGPVDCSDLDGPCVTGRCDENGDCTLEALPDGAACDDGNSCTVGESCQGGACSGGVGPDCSDLDGPCTVGGCDANGQCVAEPRSDDTPCDDGDACTLGDSCQAGSCESGPAPDCTGLDGPCTTGACDDRSGECVAVPAPENAPCDDDNSCTAGETCTAGECTGGVGPDCSALDGPCSRGACDANGACFAELLDDGTACDDGDPCTVGDSCAQGSCEVGAPVDCSALDDECGVGVCGANGECEVEPLPDGTDCEDFDACTTGESCQGGACVGGTPPDCSALDTPCARGVCDATGGCTAEALPDGASCEDGDACTVNTLCTNGVCGGGAPLDCSALDSACTVGECNAAGDCESAPRADGTDCDDGDLCTSGESCQGGACQGGAAVDCSGLDGECAQGRCDGATGSCVRDNANQGQGCDDGDACTSGETCQNGECAGGAGPDCSAFDGPCTVGTCDAGGNCVAQPIANGTDCDDGDACTTGTTCNAGTCGGGAAVDCSALDGVCVQGVCDANDGCTTAPVADGSACDDDNPCTEGESCQTGVCAGGTEPDCSGLDGPCTEGICLVSSGGCVRNNANQGQACDDGDACSTGDTCDRGECRSTGSVDCSALDSVCATGVCNAAGDCEAQPIADGTACDDNDACTTDTSCRGGVCADGAPVDCSALDGVCVQGSCDPAQGCVTENRTDGSSCDDGNPCTEGESCQTGSCTGGTEPDCSGLDDQCVEGICLVSAGGCVRNNANQGQPCDDGDGCTSGDTCDRGECRSTGGVDCSAFDGPCTVGTCDDNGDCFAQPIADGTACDDGSACTTGTTCSSGTCGGGNPVDCSGLDGECVVGTCDDAAGCTTASRADGTACGAGDLCNTGRTCTGGSCGAGTPVDCSAFDGDCSVGECDPTDGSCVRQDANEGANCSDGNPCTENESCVSGSCEGGSALDCSALDDPDACQVGDCDPAQGCVQVDAADGSACGGTVCESAGACASGTCGGSTPTDCSAFDSQCEAGQCSVGDGGCIAVPANQGNACNDGDNCSTGEACDQGACVGGTPLDCSVLDNECGVGECNPANGTCTTSALPNGTACDSAPCIEGQSCIAGICAGGTPKDCTGLDDVCRVGQCDPNGDCIQVDAPNGTGCDDGDVCTGGEFCTDGICGGGGDLCGCPDGDLGSAVGNAVVDDTTAGAGNQLSGGCGGDNGLELSYLWTSPSVGTFDIDTNGSSFDTVLYVLTGGCGGAEAACDDDGGTGRQSALQATMDVGTQLAIVVDGFNASANGDFVLNINQVSSEVGLCDNNVDDDGDGVRDCADPDCAVTDACNCPGQDIGTGIGNAVATGTTVGSGDDHEGSCGGSTAEEISLLFSAPSAGRYTFDTIGSNFDTVMYIRDAECGGAQLGCDDDIGTGNRQSELTLELAANQSVVVFVDGFRDSSGDYVLNISKEAEDNCTDNVDNDVDGLTDCNDADCEAECTCPAADLGRAVGNSVTTGSIIGSVNSQSSTCGGAESGDIGYLWEAPATGNWTFDTTGSDFNTVLHLRNGATCNSPQLACNNDIDGGNTASRVQVALTAGQQIVVFVDGASSAEGNYVLNINGDAESDCFDSVDNDGDGDTDCSDGDCDLLCSCLTGTLGTTVGNSVATGTIVGATNSLSSSCGGAESGDHAYRWTAPADGVWIFDTLGSSFNTVLHLRNGVACNSAQLACNNDIGGGETASRVQVGLSAGEELLIFVDGASAAEGAYQLNINQLTETACGDGVDNDSDGQTDCSDTDCTSVCNCLDGDLGTSTGASVATGSIVGATNHQSSTCGGAESGDAAFTWQAPSDGIFDFDTIGSSFNTVLHLRDGNTCTASQLACNNDIDGGNTASRVSATVTAGQQLVVFVDGASGGEGDYVLNINRQAEALCDDGADNDSDGQTDCNDSDCNLACTCISGDLGQVLGASVATGSTAGAVNSQSSTCGGAESGDVAWLWQAPSNGVFVFDTAGSDYDTVLHVRDGSTCDSPQLSCNNNAGGGGTTSQLPVALTAGQQVVVLVDGASGAEGNYVLNISQLTETQCSDGTDNDSDGQTDCNDSDCDAQCDCTDGNLGTATGNGVAGGSIVGAANSQSSTCGGAESGDAAYLWQAPSAGNWVFSTAGSDFDTVLHLRDGTTCSSPQLACNNNAAGGGVTSEIQVALTAGQQLVIFVDGGSGAEGNFTLNINRATEALCNDSVDNDDDGQTDCNDSDCNAQCACYDSNLGQAIGNNVATGSIVGEPNQQSSTCGGGESGDRAYLWNAPSNGTWVFDTSGSNYNTVLHLRDGTTCFSPQLACNNDVGGGVTSSRIEATLNSGQQVVIFVDGASGAEGDFVLNINPLSDCPSEVLGGAIGNAVSTGSNEGSGADQAGSCGGNTGEDFPIQFTAPSSGRYTFDTVGSNYDTLLHIRDGGCDGSELACNDDIEPGNLRSTLTLFLTTGQTVIVFVDAFNSDGGNYVLNISKEAETNCSDSTDNDADGDTDCADSDCSAFCACPSADLGTTTGPSVATGDTRTRPNSQSSSCGGAESGDEAYTWRAPNAGDWIFDTFGSDYDTVLHVRDGSSCSSPQLGCNNDAAAGQTASRVELALAANQQVVIFVDGGSSAEGNYVLNINESTGERSLSGLLTYDFVKPTASGLDYDNIEQRPIRGAIVQLLDASDDSVLSTTTSTDTGSYSFTFFGTNLVKIRVLAQSTTPSITIEDNTNSNATYSIESGNIDTDVQNTASLNAGSGWGGSSYTGTRAAGPFAVLDRGIDSARTFSDVRTVTYPAMRFRWSPNNRPESGDLTLGQIGTSFWNGTAVYLLGQADVDSDEYDQHVVVHEWGHYFESNVTRTDSVGGPHGGGDILDPRIAWSEGFANALSAIVLDPEITYIDTVGNGQGFVGVFSNMEANSTGDPSPGWFSERSVQRIVYDVYDSANDSPDTVSLGVGPLYDALTGPFRSTPALATIFSAIDALKDQNPGSATALDNLVNGRSIDDVADSFGAGETNDGGDANALPVYRDISIGGSNVTVTLTGGTQIFSNFNKLQANRYLRFTGTGQRVTVSTNSNNNVDMYIARDGQLIVARRTSSGNESSTFNTTNGSTYVISIQGWHNVEEDYNCVVSVNPKSHPPMRIEPLSVGLDEALLAVEFTQPAKDVELVFSGIKGIEVDGDTSSFVAESARPGEIYEVPVRYGLSEEAGLISIGIRGEFPSGPGILMRTITIGDPAVLLRNSPRNIRLVTTEKGRQLVVMPAEWVE